MSVAINPSRTSRGARLVARGYSAGVVIDRLRVPVIVALSLAAVAVLSLSWVVPALADDADNLSFYQLASNAASYFGNQKAPGESGEIADVWFSVTKDTGAAGSLLGYADATASAGSVIGWLFSDHSGSSQTMAYSALTTEAIGTGNFGLLSYAYYGATLRALGLDAMSDSGGVMNMIGGGVVFFAYLMAMAVNLIFSLVIGLLQAANPFRWFYEGVAGIVGYSSGTSQWMADGMTNNTGTSELGTIGQWVAGWYGLLQTMAWTVMVPLFLAVLLVSIFVFRRANTGSRVRRFITRLLFLGVGLPLLGSMYTATIDKLDAEANTGSTATRVVVSNYVDFSAWMMNDRLAVPAGTNISSIEGRPTAAAEMGLRATALEINRQAHPQVYGPLGSMVNTQATQQSLRDQIAAATAAEVTGGQDTSAVASFVQTLGLITRHIQSAPVSASDFETGIKAEISNLNLGDTARDWFTNGYDDAGESFGQSGLDPMNNPLFSMRHGLQATEHPRGSGQIRYTSQAPAVGCGFAVANVNADPIEPASCNLSPLAAYNYLNTSFHPDTMTTFSSNKVLSGMSRENHMAVVQIGSGPTKLIYWLSTVTILGSAAVLGFAYALGMLTSAIKRGFSLIAAVPFATLGSLAGIAKVLIYTVVMVLEILVTFFLYSFVVEFMLSIPGFLASTLSQIISNPSAVLTLGTIGLPGGVSMPLGNVLSSGVAVVFFTALSIIITVSLTVVLLRVRKVAIKAIDEEVTKLIQRLVDTPVAPPTPPKTGVGGALGQGVVAGAGMAMGKRAMANLPGVGAGAAGAVGAGAVTNTGGTNAGSSGTSAGSSAAATKGSTAARGASGAATGEAGTTGSSSRELKGVKQARTDAQAREQAAAVRQQGGLSKLGFGQRTPEQRAAAKAERAAERKDTVKTLGAAAAGVLGGEGISQAMGIKDAGKGVKDASSSSARSQRTEATGTDTERAMGNTQTSSTNEAKVRVGASESRDERVDRSTQARSAQTEDQLSQQVRSDTQRNMAGSDTSAEARTRARSNDELMRDQQGNRVENARTDAHTARTDSRSDLSAGSISARRAEALEQGQSVTQREQANQERAVSAQSQDTVTQQARTSLQATSHEDRQEASEAAARTNSRTELEADQRQRQSVTEDAATTARVASRHQVRAPGDDQSSVDTGTASGATTGAAVGAAAGTAAASTTGARQADQKQRVDAPGSGSVAQPVQQEQPQRVRSSVAQTSVGSGGPTSAQRAPRQPVGETAPSRTQATGVPANARPETGTSAQHSGTVPARRSPVGAPGTNSTATLSGQPRGAAGQSVSSAPVATPTSSVASTGSTPGAAVSTPTSVPASSSASTPTPMPTSATSGSKAHQPAPQASAARPVQPQAPAVPASGRTAGVNAQRPATPAPVAAGTRAASVASAAPTAPASPAPVTPRVTSQPVAAAPRPQAPVTAPTAAGVAPVVPTVQASVAQRGSAPVAAPVTRPAVAATPAPAVPVSAPARPVASTPPAAQPQVVRATTSTSAPSPSTPSAVSPPNNTVSEPVAQPVKQAPAAKVNPVRRARKKVKPSDT